MDARAIATRDAITTTITMISDASSCGVRISILTSIDLEKKGPIRKEPGLCRDWLLTGVLVALRDRLCSFTDFFLVVCGRGCHLAGFRRFGISLDLYRGQDLFLPGKIIFPLKLRVCADRRYLAFEHLLRRLHRERELVAGADFRRLGHEAMVVLRNALLGLAVEL